ncbi:MAG: glycine zipper family protein [Rickettsiales bacterium]|jgi:hypothetical protein|nr:glycine zipper family protein [Rickettsiales bacterium]MDR1261340.1 glycine zipper family protein [Rickettsiales bacterium]
MESSGAASTDYSDQFIENIVKYIREKPDLVSKLENLLKDNEDFKKIVEKSEDVPVKDIVELLKGNEDLSKGAIDIVKEYLEKDNNELKMLLEQVNKVEGMEEKLEALGSQLSIQGVIGGAAITALTGALAGTLAIGGVAGALMGGGLALAGLVALVAIAAIGYAIYQHREEIGQGVVNTGQAAGGGILYIGKAVKSLVKDLIDKLPTIQKRENNFAKLKSDLLEQHHHKSAEEEKKTTLNNKIEIIRMLQDKDQQSAIEKLVEEEEIKFPEMKKLIEKGDSTHVDDMDKLKDFMDDFLPKIMAIGEGRIEKVEEKVNEKVKEMKPPGSTVKNPSSELASPEEEIKK